MKRSTKRKPIDTLLSASLVAGALMLAGCSTSAQTPTGTDSAETAATKVSGETESPGFAVPEMRNFTPFGNVLLTGQDNFGEYFSLSTKIAFEFDVRGVMTLAKQQEPMIGAKDDPVLDRECTDKGGGLNQRTTWFPDTGLFVRDGTLQSIRLASGKAGSLVPLSRDERGSMMVMGQRARQIEYFWIPCVGKHRVARGHRLNDFLPRGATLVVKPSKGNPVELSLPQPVEPFLLLRYREGAMIPVPMRPVLVTVDMPERRMVVQYQATFSLTPPIRKIELRAILPSGGPAPDETAERFRERTDATLNDLRLCPPPTKPMEPCATPNRVVDRRIFGH